MKVELQPADGFGVLLPGEERWVEATFSPFSAVVHDSSVALRTSLGQKTTIRQVWGHQLNVVDCAFLFPPILRRSKLGGFPFILLSGLACELLCRSSPLGENAQNCHGLEEERGERAVDV